MTHKLLASISMMLFTTIATMAQFYTIMVNRTDGSYLSISIKDDMQTAFDQGAMTLTSSLGTITFDLPNVAGWTFSDHKSHNAGWTDDDDITLPTALSTDLELSDTTLTLRNLTTYTRVALYDAHGTTIRSYCGADSYSIPLTDLSAGVYILAYGNNSLKFAVK
jgi:hypothetical protein